MTAIASRSQLRMSLLRYALVTVPLVLLLGLVSGRLANSGTSNPWFDALVKPATMPPGATFGIAWTILYILLGLSLAMILHARGANRRREAIGLFLVQLVLNYAWSPLFFAAHKVTLALGLIAAIFIIAAAAASLFARIRKVAALLMVPYLAWLAFAGYLNFEIKVLNPNAETLVPQSGNSNVSIEL